MSRPRGPAGPAPSPSPSDHAPAGPPAAVRSPAAPSEHQGPASVRQLWVLMATVFVDMIGAMIVLPLLPFYVLQMKAKPSVVGPLIATFFVAQFACSPLWGRLSDRYGRRPMILAGLLMSAGAFTLFGFASTLAVLFLSRLVQGLGSGTVGVVQAYVSDSVPPEERAKALGWVTAATSAGVVVGPEIGSAAAHFGTSAPGFFAAGLCLLNVLFAWRWLPESKRQVAVPAGGTAGAAGAAAPAEISVWTRLLDVMRQPTSSIGSLIWVYAIGMMAFMAMTSVLGLYLAKDFGVTKESIGPFYSYIGVVSVVMRALLLGPVVRRVGEVGAMRLGTLALSCGMLALPLPVLLPVPASARLLTVAFIATLVPVGTALLFPSTTALVSGRSPRNETGQIMGVQQLFGGIARCLGPVWSTWLFTQSVVAPFWAAAAFMLGGGVLTWRLRPEVRVRPAPAAGPCATSETGLGEAEIMSHAAAILSDAGGPAGDAALDEAPVGAGAPGRHQPS